MPDAQVGHLLRPYRKDTMVGFVRGDDGGGIFHVAADGRSLEGFRIPVADLRDTEQRLGAEFADGKEFYFQYAGIPEPQHYRVTEVTPFEEGWLWVGLQPIP